MCLLYFPITFLFQELSWHFTWIWTPITTATTLSSIAKNCNNSKTTFAWKTVEKQLWELPVWKGRRRYRARPQGAGEAAELLWIFKISSTCKADLRLQGFPWSSSLVLRNENWQVELWHLQQGAPGCSGKPELGFRAEGITYLEVGCCWCWRGSLKRHAGVQEASALPASPVRCTGWFFSSTSHHWLTGSLEVVAPFISLKDFMRQ